MVIKSPPIKIKNSTRMMQFYQFQIMTPLVVGTPILVNFPVAVMCNKDWDATWSILRSISYDRAGLVNFLMKSITQLLGDPISNRYLTEGDVQNPPPKKRDIYYPSMSNHGDFRIFFSPWWFVDRFFDRPMRGEWYRWWMGRCPN